MGKGKKKPGGGASKRPAPAPPKGLPVRPSKLGRVGGVGGSAVAVNPFDDARPSLSRRPKFEVHNRPISGRPRPSSAASAAAAGGGDDRLLRRPVRAASGPSSALARSVERRRTVLREALRRERKAGGIVDGRIGEGGRMEDEEDRMLARVVRERAHRSGRAAKFSLEEGDDDDGDGGGGALTHGGRVIDDAYDGGGGGADDVILSDGDDDDLDLDRADTELHFGGGAFDRSRLSSSNPYGPSYADGYDGGGRGRSLGEAYRTRREELEDQIRRRKEAKAERARQKEGQHDAFETMDGTFKELAALLRFRDKGRREGGDTSESRSGSRSRSRSRSRSAGAGAVDEEGEGEDEDMESWQREMRTYIFERRVRATDRTKTPEEVAKEEAERLRDLEERRVARMRGEFEDDDLTDVSDDDDDDDGDGNKRRRRGGKRGKGGGGKGAEEEKRRRKRRAEEEKRKRRGGERNPDELDSDDDDGGGAEGEDELEARFTADGMVLVGRDGRVVRKLGDDDDDADEEARDTGDDDGESSGGSSEDGPDDDDDGAPAAATATDSSSSASDSESDGDGDDDGDGDAEEKDDEDEDKDGAPPAAPEVGDRVSASYHAEEQLDGHEAWYDGVIAGVTSDGDGNALYDVTYDDGDFEDGVKAEHIRLLSKGGRAHGEEDEEKARLVRKRRKARDEARAAIPFVFQVPTTLEALHELIAEHATTGRDVSLIVERIHASNSVRLDRNNREKMQNFYDVLLRRFVAVGDAIYRSGDGGDDLGRYGQLDDMVGALYSVAQDDPEMAGAVWGRRLGVMQRALAKRLRDAAVAPPPDEEEGEDGDGDGAFTAWPSAGSLLLLRAQPHVFPPTDARHPVVTPALLLLGQALSQAPVRSAGDLTRGLFCAGLAMEYCREAGRMASEAAAFLAGTLRMFAPDAAAAARGGPVPSLERAAAEFGMGGMRAAVIAHARGTRSEGGGGGPVPPPKLSLERERMRDPGAPTAALLGALRLVRRFADDVGGKLGGAEAEALDEISGGILSLQPPKGTPKSLRLPKSVADAVKGAADAVSAARGPDRRDPLRRRPAAAVGSLAVRSLAPRLEDPRRYDASSRDRNKSRRRAEMDRARRECARERRAAARELRLDGAFVEGERRAEAERRDGKAREARRKNFVWLEGEQAAMNQQVRMGGGLLSGGGTGAARAKARTGTLGVKKGGKMR